MLYLGHVSSRIGEFKDMLTVNKRSGKTKSDSGEKGEFLGCG